MWGGRRGVVLRMPSIQIGLLMVRSLSPLERQQHVIVDHLLVGREIVENADHAEHQAVAVEALAPFGEVAGGKNPVEQFDQFDRACTAFGAGGKARVGDEILAAQAPRQRRPLSFLVESDRISQRPPRHS